MRQHLSRYEVERKTKCEGEIIGMVDTLSKLGLLIDTCSSIYLIYPVAKHGHCASNKMY